MAGERDRAAKDLPPGVGGPADSVQEATQVETDNLKRSNTGAPQHEGITRQGNSPGGGTTGDASSGLVGGGGATGGAGGNLSGGGQ